MGNDLIGTLELLKTHRGTGTGSGPRQWEMWSFPLPSLGICQDFFLFFLLVVVFSPFPFGITKGKALRTASSAAGWLHCPGCIWKRL